MSGYVCGWCNGGLEFIRDKSSYQWYCRACRAQGPLRNGLKGCVLSVGDVRPSRESSITYDTITDAPYRPGGK